MLLKPIMNYYIHFMQYCIDNPAFGLYNNPCKPKMTKGKEDRYANRTQGLVRSVV